MVVLWQITPGSVPYEDQGRDGVGSAFMDVSLGLLLAPPNFPNEYPTKW